MIWLWKPKCWLVVGGKAVSTVDLRVEWKLCTGIMEVVCVLWWKTKMVYDVTVMPQHSLLFRSFTLTWNDKLLYTWLAELVVMQRACGVGIGKYRSTWKNCLIIPDWTTCSTVSNFPSGLVITRTSDSIRKPIVFMHICKWAAFCGSVWGIFRQLPNSCRTTTRTCTQKSKFGWSCQHNVDKPLLCKTFIFASPLVVLVNWQHAETLFPPGDHTIIWLLDIAVLPLTT